MRLACLLIIVVFGLIFGGCGEDALSDRLNVPENSVLKLISESGADVCAGAISRQMSTQVGLIPDDEGKVVFLRSCADAIRLRFIKMSRVRGGLVGADPNFWLAVGCCDEMRKAGLPARECLSLPFEVIQAVCDEIELTESGAGLDGVEWSGNQKERNAHVRGLSSSVKQWTTMLERFALKEGCWKLPDHERQAFLGQINCFVSIAERSLKGGLKK